MRWRTRCLKASSRPRTTGVGFSIPGISILNGGTVGSTPTAYCHVASGFLTDFRGLSSYQIPKVDVEIGVTFQTKPGARLAANYAVPASVIAQSLGRAPAGNVANVTVNLIEPGTLYGDRINELDLRIAKVLKFGGMKARAQVDFYNLTNSSAGADLQQHLQPHQHDVAHADIGAFSPSRQDRLHVRILTRQSPGNAARRPEDRDRSSGR